MEWFDRIVDSYIQVSQDYRQAINEWNRFFSSTETKEGKVDFVLLKDKIGGYRDEINDILGSYIQKRNDIWDALLKTLLSDKSIDIRQYLEQDVLEDFDDLVSNQFDDDKTWEQFTHFIKLERSRLDRDWITNNILSTAKDPSWCPVSLFQKDQEGRTIFAPYITLHGRKHIFDTSYEHLRYISDKIFLSWWDVRVSLSEFIDRSGFKLKSNELQIIFDKNHIKVPDMRVQTVQFKKDIFDKNIDFQYNTLPIDPEILSDFLWFDLYKVYKSNKQYSDIFNPIEYIKSSPKKSAFWNYILSWFIANERIDQYYKLNKKQESAMYILKTFYSDEFIDLWNIFDYLIWNNIAHGEDILNKSNMLHNIIIFLFETTLIKLVSDRTKYDIYKTLPYDDINSGIDIVVYDKRASYNDHTIQFVDLKSSAKSLRDIKTISRQWNYTLWPDLSLFLKERYWYDVISSIQNSQLDRYIIQVPLGSSKDNYNNVEMYIKLLLSFGKEINQQGTTSTNQKKITSTMRCMEDQFGSHFARSYIKSKRGMNNITHKTA